MMQAAGATDPQMMHRVPLYRGRIAPTPTGLLHLGHAQTFRTAWQRARAAGGCLVYRQEDLDPLRCTAAFAQAAIDDLHRYGLDWDEGPDCTPQGCCAPYCQSQRTRFYRTSLARLIRSGHAYPDTHSRSDLSKALKSGLAHPCPTLFGEQDSEAIFPKKWRPTLHEWFANAPRRTRIAEAIEACSQSEPATAARHDNASTIAVCSNDAPATAARHNDVPATAGVSGDVCAAHQLRPCNPANIFPSGSVTWRLRVPDGETIRFTDINFGEQSFTAGKDFGDFILWRRDGVPAYELAVVADDIAMGITEVVRGADLLRSTARQLLLYRAFEANPPAFCHCPLVLDPQTGKRLAKRSDSLSLRALLQQGQAACKKPH